MYGEICEKQFKWRKGLSSQGGKKKKKKNITVGMNRKFSLEVGVLESTVAKRPTGGLGADFSLKGSNDLGNQ